MKCQIILPACLLLLWTLTALVRCQEASKPEIDVKTISDGIELRCTTTNFKIEGGDDLKLAYIDENTGEYTCKPEEALAEQKEGAKIFVKFRSCDNCIELDVKSIVGLALGDVVATIVIGVAVYLFVAHGRIGPVSSPKKRSDRQHLVPNEMTPSRTTDDHYQPLKHKAGQKDTYDMLSNKRNKR